MSAEVKTKKHVRTMWPIENIRANPDNPNEMTDKQFNLLYDNIERLGITDPLLCVPHPDFDCDVEKGTGILKIIGGEHRWEVAKLIGIKEVPVTIVTEGFDEEEQKFQIVRHNIIHGQMSPAKFLRLYESLSEEYTDEVAAEMFGFSDEEEFKKLIDSTAKSLPDEMKEEFKEAAKEIKTIDDLTKVLNHLFATYGDTLDYGFMILDYGGKDSVWLRMRKNTKPLFDNLSKACIQSSVTVDSAVNKLLAKLAEDEEMLTSLLEDLPKVEKVAEHGVSTEEQLSELDKLDEFLS